MKRSKIPFFLSLAVIALAGSASAQTGTLQVRGMAASCASCHGTNGLAAPGMVALAGYARADLIKAMADFKSGERPATIMHQLAKGYSDQQIEAIAGYFAAQKQ